jgi:hypothetical protein
MMKLFIYKNTLNDSKTIKKNFLSIAFNGSGKNKKGIGAFAEIYYNHQKQVYENEPCRGYLSCTDSKAFFGLDTTSLLDSVVIRWPNHFKQVLTNVKANQTLIVNIANADIKDDWHWPAIDSAALFK